MAIAVRQQQHRVVHRPPWVRRRGGEPDAVLAMLMLAMVMGGSLVVAASLALPSSPAAFSLRSLYPSEVAARPRAGFAPIAVTSVIAPAEATRAASVPASDVAPSAPDEAPSAPDVAPSAPDEAPAAEMTAASWQPRIGEAARVAHTDGLDVVLHAAPSTGARLPAGLLEGTRITVLEAVGPDWVRVQTDTGPSGWIPSGFLAADQ